MTKYKSILLFLSFLIIANLSAEKFVLDRIDLTSYFEHQNQDHCSYIPQKNNPQTKQSDNSTPPTSPSQTHDTSLLGDNYATICEVGNHALHITIKDEGHKMHTQPYKQTTLNQQDYYSYNLYNQNTIAPEKTDRTTKEIAGPKQTKKARRKERSKNRHKQK